MYVTGIGWLHSYDPSFRHPSGYPTGEATFTCDRDKAMEFDTFQEAAAFWTQQDEQTPTRPDGKPNRPLTAYTVEITRQEGPFNA